MTMAQRKHCSNAYLTVSEEIGEMRFCLRRDRRNVIEIIVCLACLTSSRLAFNIFLRVALDERLFRCSAALYIFRRQRRVARY